MNLTQLANLIARRREEFQNAVRKEAGEVTLEDVLKEIIFHPEMFMICGRYSYFKDGQEVEFMFHQGWYKALVSEDKLILEGPYNIEISRFEGRRVKSYYEELVAKIKKIQEEEDLPF